MEFEVIEKNVIVYGKCEGWEEKQILGKFLKSINIKGQVKGEDFIVRIKIYDFRLYFVYMFF